MTIADNITAQLEAAARLYDDAGLDGECGAILCRNAKAIIERQSAEIERLHTERRRLLRQIGTEQDQPEGE